MNIETVKRMIVRRAESHRNAAAEMETHHYRRSRIDSEKASALAMENLLADIVYYETKSTEAT